MTVYDDNAYTVCVDKSKHPGLCMDRAFKNSRLLLPAVVGGIKIINRPIDSLTGAFSIPDQRRHMEDY